MKDAQERILEKRRQAPTSSKVVGKRAAAKATDAGAKVPKASSPHASAADSPSPKSFTAVKPLPKGDKMPSPRDANYKPKASPRDTRVTTKPTLDAKSKPKAPRDARQPNILVIIGDMSIIVRRMSVRGRQKRQTTEERSSSRRRSQNRPHAQHRRRTSGYPAHR